MKELEHTRCEVRKIIEIQASIWDGLNPSDGDEFRQSAGSPASRGSDIPRGSFLEDANHAWLSNGSRLVVINTKTGENISSWTFCQKVTAVAQFPTQPGDVLLLLVGLDNGANRAKDSAGMLCIFDCSTSRVLRSIRMPAGVEQVCVMNGGAEWEDFNEKRTHGMLSNSSGIACVALRNLYHIVLDLRRVLWDGDVSYLTTNELSPADIELSEDRYSLSSRQRCDRGIHKAYNLLNPGIEDFIRFNREEFESSPLYDENFTTTLIYAKKIGCVISGCLGRVIIWQNDGSIGWISASAKNSMAISHLALLEPADDPRPFYYLWVAYQEETFETAPILKMYALLIERRYCDKETNLHFKIEGEPSLKFDLQLEPVDRITNLVSIERMNNCEQSEPNNKKGDASLLLIGLSGKALLFDLNQWYREHLPRNIHNCQNPNTFLCYYQMKSETLNIADDMVLSCAYSPLTLREFPNNGGNSLDELFYPKSLCLDWVELTNNHLRIWMTRGLQWELLRDMAIAGPSILIQPSETFHKCLAAGLVPFNTDCSFDCDQNAQREMLLSLCLEQRWASFLIKCAKEWGDGSVSYLFPMFLRWGAQRASSLKMVADQLCIPLFDQSGSTIGDKEIKLLRFCSQQLECLSTVVARLPIPSDDLVKQQRALRRVATHLGVLLWFYDVGLLPETHEVNDEPLPITFSLQIPYPYERLAAIYKNKRQQIRENTVSPPDRKEELFIDELMTEECQALRSQWEREGGDITTGGYYPPPSLQSLLRSYLFDCYNQNESDEIENKHQITIYLLMDLVKLLQGSCPDVDQLIKYPSAFKMSPSLIKLTQAFWLLDHEDYQGFLDTLTGQLVSDSDVKEWHHKLVIRTLIRNNEYKIALIYLRVRKPPLSAICDQSTSISLSVECGLVQTAFHQRPQSHYRQLLTCFFQACKACGKLNEILQLALDPEEEEAFVKFLEGNKLEETRLLYYLQRCRYTEAGSAYQSSLSKTHLKNIQSASLTMVQAYNATLPDVTKALSLNSVGKFFADDTEPRHLRPMSHKQSCSRSHRVFETVLEKVKETYVRRDNCQIPFISAPCTSLRLKSMKTNSSCVLFPTLVPKTLRKRTRDQMIDDEVHPLAAEKSKRRKLSGETDTPSKSSVSILSTGVAFETPLIKRKKPLSDKMECDMETPHSILKIRQLIQSSTSPTILTRDSLNQQQDDLFKQQERKPTRQIRFSIGQSLNDSSHEEAAVESSNIADKDNTSEVSEEVFYSPNTSSKSQSANSSHSIMNIKGPRARPSLRSSGHLSSSESLIESRDPLNKMDFRAIPSNHSLSEQSSLTATPIALPRKSISSVPEHLKLAERYQHLRCSVSPITPHSALNESRYLSSVLSSDSSSLSTPAVTSKHGNSSSRAGIGSGIEKSNICSNTREYKYPMAGRNLVSVEMTKSKTVTRSLLSKTVITEEIDNDDDDRGDQNVVVEVDDFGLDHEPEVCFVVNKLAEEYLPDHQENDQISNERGDSEEYNNAFKADGTVISKTYEQTKQQSNKEKLEDQDMYSSQNSEEPETSEDGIDHPGDLDNDMDDYEPELTALKERAEDEENAECFQSLTNSAASFREPSESEIFINALSVHESGGQDEDRELQGLSKPSLIENSNITEDESSNDITEVSQKVVNKSQSKTNNWEFLASSHTNTKEFSLSMPNKDMNESNFTEDESISSIEHFELIADDSDMEEDCNQDLTKKKHLVTTNGERRTQWTKQVADGFVYDSRVQNPRCNTKRFDNSKKSTELENPAILSETDSAMTTVSATDIPSSSGAESTRYSPLSTSYQRGKTSENKGREKSKSPTPVRLTRARRASSVTNEVLASARNNLKPIDVVDSLENSAKLVDVESVNEPESVRARGKRRSASVDKELLSVLEENVEEIQTNKPEIALRRSSRRAASAQREMSTIQEISHDSLKHSTLTSISETDFSNESEPINKKGQRSRKVSHTSQDNDISLITRSKRSVSVAKETAPESQSTSRTTRKRGNSVPKEIFETSRTRRASSLAKDIISEETTKSPAVIKRPKSSLLVQSSEESAVNSPAKNTRSRRVLSQSIPEEKDEEMSYIQTRGRSSSNASDVSTQKKSKERRAASLEPSKSEVKKRTRRTFAKNFVSDEKINEEPVEDNKEDKAETAKRTSRKRTDSATSIPGDSNTEKVRGGRKASRSKSSNSDVFVFSPPDVTSDPPSSQQDVEEVPPYVFSPPHTRSRQPVLSQLRRKMKNFLSPLTTEEKASVAHRNRRTKRETFQYTTQRTLFVYPRRTRKPSTE
ncbi:protein ELYS isoform X1 [Neodiprion lecontei]|uniref:Protein ELYS isoform X1 n=1 Tax=Neodiprion lecontei TaxID=441921 RepID=A0ABM3FWL1_NEOLC|nr:protein ELYS isoform X1 [Neodiprion lecontei]